MLILQLKKLGAQETEELGKKLKLFIYYLLRVIFYADQNISISFNFKVKPDIVIHSCLPHIF
ncbi:MAG: hypothetical protein V1704_03465 [Candidatus Vogelbacteria bacterium]